MKCWNKRVALRSPKGRNNLILLFLTTLLLQACAFQQPRLMHIATQEEAGEAKRLIQKGRSSQAIEELTALIEMEPKSTELLFLRGVSYQKSDQFKEAVLDYEEVLKIDPAFTKAYYNLGMIYEFKMNSSFLALKNFDQFLTQKPHHPKAALAAQQMCHLDLQQQYTCASCLEEEGNRLIQKGNKEKGLLLLLKGEIFAKCEGRQP